jgi:hypothetical protein
MGLFDKSSGKFFGGDITPKCSYCHYGKKAKEGGKILCEKRGMVDSEYSCKSFVYSPLKRIPVKQLHIPGNLDIDSEDDDK